MCSRQQLLATRDFGRRVEGLTQNPGESATARFEDGSSTTGDDVVSPNLTIDDGNRINLDQISRG